MNGDKRPDPKPRMYPGLWQTYLQWESIQKLLVGSKQRQDSIEKGKSVMSTEAEIAFRELLSEWPGRDKKHSPLEVLKRNMIEAAEMVGPVWKWGTSLRGLGTGYMFAQLLAHIDYPGYFEGCKYPDNFNTVSKLWRFCGLAVIDGEAEFGTKHYHRKIKSLLLRQENGIVDQFVKQRTYPYREIYDEHKEKESEKYPNPLCSVCGAVGVKKQVNKKTKWICPEGCRNPNDESKYALVNYTPMHLHVRAYRKVAKVFIQHLWVVWRESEGLPVSKPWVLEHGGHVDYIPPPNWPLRE